METGLVGRCSPYGRIQLLKYFPQFVNDRMIYDPVNRTICSSKVSPNSPKTDVLDLLAARILILPTIITVCILKYIGARESIKITSIFEPANHGKKS